MFCCMHRNRGDASPRTMHSPVCAVRTRNKGLMLRGVSSQLCSSGEESPAFQLGSLAPALHRGPGLISYLLQRIFCYVRVGVGVSGVLVFTADCASPPGTSRGHSGTAFILSLIHSCPQHMRQVPGGGGARRRDVDTA